MSTIATKDSINIRSELSKLKNQNRYGAGWQDLIAPLNNSNAPGLSPPNWTAMGSNGHYGLHFTAGESAFVTFHVTHDWAGCLSYPHIHFLVDIDMTVPGETITWKLHYTIARGHHQTESLTGIRETITLTYTTDGTETAGEHLILECSDAQAIDMLEVDSVIVMEVEMDAASVTGTEKIYGLMADIHYESSGTLTNEKSPEFTKNV